MNVNERLWDFTATIVVTSSEGGGPEPDSLGLPESGIRNVPMGMDGIEGYHTVQLQAEGSAVFRKGAAETVKCTLLSPEVFVGRIVVDAEFVLWAGEVFATGRVTDVR